MAPKKSADTIQEYPELLGGTRMPPGTKAALAAACKLPRRRKSDFLRDAILAALASAGHPVSAQSSTHESASSV
jgi:hypothetical protein